MTEFEMECKIAEDILKQEGLELNPEYCTIEAIVDTSAYWPVDYDIYQWIEDTKMNEPKCFKKGE